MPYNGLGTWEMNRLVASGGVLISLQLKVFWDTFREAMPQLSLEPSSTSLPEMVAVLPALS